MWDITNVIYNRTSLARSAHWQLPSRSKAKRKIQQSHVISLGAIIDDSKYSYADNGYEKHASDRDNDKRSERNDHINNHDEHSSRRVATSRRLESERYRCGYLSQRRQRRPHVDRQGWVIARDKSLRCRWGGKVEAKKEEVEDEEEEEEAKKTDDKVRTF